MRVVIQASLAVACAVGASCTDFEQEEQVRDMRVLAIRTFPAEFLFSPLFLTPPAQRPFPPPPLGNLNFEIIAPDPRGGTADVTTQWCPENAQDSTCRQDTPDTLLAGVDSIAAGVLRPLLTPVSTEAPILLDDTSVAYGQVTTPELLQSLPAEFVDFVQNKDDNGNVIPSVFPLLPRIVVNVDNRDAEDKAINPDVDNERAFKRVPLSVNLADPMLPPQLRDVLAENLGIVLCEGSIDDDPTFTPGETSDCLYTKRPNQNPDLKGFILDNSSDPKELTKEMLYGTDPDLGAVSRSIVSGGGPIGLTPMFGEGSVERYQVLSFDIANSKIKIVNRVEDIVVEYFVTRGQLTGTKSALEFIDTLGSIWTTPSPCDTTGDRDLTCSQSGERDSLVMVARDQRGGVSSVTMNVQFR
jgi:hypothetical protein